MFVYANILAAISKMDLREIGFGDVDWIHWAQDRDRWRALVNTVLKNTILNIFLKGKQNGAVESQVHSLHSSPLL
jgi:hypothetical protein